MYGFTSVVPSGSRYVTSSVRRRRPRVRHQHEQVEERPRRPLRQEPRLRRRRHPRALVPRPEREPVRPVQVHRPLHDDRPPGGRRHHRRAVRARQFRNRVHPHVEPRPRPHGVRSSPPAPRSATGIAPPRRRPSCPGSGSGRTAGTPPASTPPPDTTAAPAPAPPSPGGSHTPHRVPRHRPVHRQRAHRSPPPWRTPCPRGPPACSPPPSAPAAAAPSPPTAPASHRSSGTAATRGRAASSTGWPARSSSMKNVLVAPSARYRVNIPRGCVLLLVSCRFVCPSASGSPLAPSAPAADCGFSPTATPTRPAARRRPCPWCSGSAAPGT